MHPLYISPIIVLTILLKNTEDHKLYKVFVDGGHGTTGLRISEYLCNDPEINLLAIDPADRKNTEKRLEMISEADVSILCLPDKASEEIALLAPKDAALIDTSSRHRTSKGWTYGMPELAPGQRDLIRNSTRVANPGCHASGFILLTRPLVDAGIIGKDALLSCFCVTGYSGGGKSMIARYEDPARPSELASPAQYALGQSHKHLPEMVKMSGLTYEPCFSPVVGDFYSGMVMTVQLHASQFETKASADDIREVLRCRYAGEPLITVKDTDPSGGFMYSDRLSGSASMALYVSGNNDRILLMAEYDNLGKGASGAALQNLNIMLGREETTGLI